MSPKLPQSVLELPPELIGLTAVMFLFPAVILAGIVAVCLPRKPLSWGKHILGFMILRVVEAYSVLLFLESLPEDLGTGHAGVLLVFVPPILALPVQLYLDSRRFLDLGWSRWWMVSCFLLVPIIPCTFVPMLFRKSKKLQSKETTPHEHIHKHGSLEG